MALFKKKRSRSVGNAPKGLSSEFQPIRSKTKGTFLHKTANGDDPLASRTGNISSIAAPLAPLR